MKRKSTFRVVGNRGFTGPKRASALSALEAWERRMMARGYSAREMYAEWEQRGCQLVKIHEDGSVTEIS